MSVITDLDSAINHTTVASPISLTPNALVLYAMLYNFNIITFTINFFVFLHIALLISVIVLLQPNLFCSKSIKIYLILIHTFFLVKIEVKIYLKGLRALICYDRICNAKGVCGTGRAFIHNKYKFI